MAIADLGTLDSNNSLSVLCLQALKNSVGKKIWVIQETMDPGQADR